MGFYRSRSDFAERLRVKIGFSKFERRLVSLGVEGVGSRTLCKV